MVGLDVGIYPTTDMTTKYGQVLINRYSRHARDFGLISMFLEQYEVFMALLFSIHVIYFKVMNN